MQFVALAPHMDLCVARESELGSVVEAECKKLLSLVHYAGKSNDSTMKLNIALILKKVYAAAINFDSMMLKSRAVVLPTMEAQGINKAAPTPYNTNTMDIRDGREWDESKVFVDYEISPLLFKIGSADGRDYDKSKVLAKAEVVVL